MENDKTNVEIEEALTAVRNIRQTLRSNVALVRPLFMDRNYIGLCLAAFFGMIGLVIWQIIVKLFFVQNGNTEVWTHYISVIYLLILFTIATTWKMLLIKKYAKENGGYSFGTFLRLPEIFNLLVDGVIILGTTAIISFVLYYRLSIVGVFLPASFIYIGIISIIAGDMYSIIEYRLSGIMTLIFSIIISIFMKSDYLLWMACSYTVYFATLAIVIKITNKEKQC